MLGETERTDREGRKWQDKKNRNRVWSRIVLDHNPKNTTCLADQMNELSWNPLSMIRGTQGMSLAERKMENRKNFPPFVFGFPSSRQNQQQEHRMPRRASRQTENNQERSALFYHIWFRLIGSRNHSVICLQTLICYDNQQVSRSDIKNSWGLHWPLLLTWAVQTISISWHQATLLEMWSIPKPLRRKEIMQWHFLWYKLKFRCDSNP